MQVSIVAYIHYNAYIIDINGHSLPGLTPRRRVEVFTLARSFVVKKVN